MSEASDNVTHPNHIGIIMDGNGRWAQQRGLPRIEGHKQGSQSCQRVIEACQELGVHYLTLYAFSAENWSRPESEVNALMELLKEFVTNELETLLKHKIRLRAIGRINELPANTRQALQEAIDATAHFEEWHLTLALNYSSRNEILDAVRSLLADAAAKPDTGETLDWDSFSRYLYTEDLPDPDLIIRTSGETRLSNFLLMQSAYAEFYFSQTHWPDFGKEHLEEAIAAFQMRERRYGMTGEQLGDKATAVAT